MGNALSTQPPPPPLTISVVLSNQTIHVTAKDSDATIIISENKESPVRIQEDSFAIVHDGYQINHASITSSNRLFWLLHKLPDWMYTGKRALASNYFIKHSELPTEAERIELKRIMGTTEYRKFQDDILQRTNQANAIHVEANTVTIID